jgi:hypothetical protein
MSSNAYSARKFDNFKAAVALHCAYSNFVQTEITIRCTPRWPPAWKIRVDGTGFGHDD